MVVIICGKYGNNRSRTENVTERTRFSKSRSNDLEDIGQGQRSPHATHLLMLVIICVKYGLVIICAKYGKNPSRTVDFFFKFSDSEKNLTRDHPGMIVIICAKYEKNPSRTVDATERTRFSKSRPNDLEDIGQGQRSLCATQFLMVEIICG